MPSVSKLAAIVCFELSKTKLLPICFLKPVVAHCVFLRVDGLKVRWAKPADLVSDAHKGFEFLSEAVTIE